jgi:hypothetical protein
MDADGDFQDLIRRVSAGNEAAAAELVRTYEPVGCTPGQVLLEHLGSSQGTRVNGSPVQRAQLHDGDRLQVAGEVFQVFLGQPHD